MGEFPVSDTQLIDETQPTDGTLGAQLDDAEREARRALNYLWQRGSVRNYRLANLVPLVQDLSVQGDKIVEMAITESPHTLVQLTGGYAGQIIWLLVKATGQDDQVIIHHNPSFIGLADSRDFYMKPGDLLALRNVGGDIEGGENGYWQEILRQVGGAVLGLISPSRDLFSVTVNDQGALVVEKM